MNFHICSPPFEQLYRAHAQFDGETALPFRRKERVAFANDHGKADKNNVVLYLGIFDQTSSDSEEWSGIIKHREEKLQKVAC